MSAAPLTRSLTAPSSTSFLPNRSSAKRMALLARSRLARYIPNFSSFSCAALAHVESLSTLLFTASKCAKESAFGSGGSTGVGRALSTLVEKHREKASCASLTSSASRLDFFAMAFDSRCDSRARRMIWGSSVSVSARKRYKTVWWADPQQIAHLVIDIGDIHDEVYIIAEIIAQYSPDDVLGDIVSTGPRSAPPSSSRPRPTSGCCPTGIQSSPSVTHM